MIMQVNELVAYPLVLQRRRGHRLHPVMPALNDLLAENLTSGRLLLVLTDAAARSYGG